MLKDEIYNKSLDFILFNSNTLFYDTKNIYNKYVLIYLLLNLKKNTLGNVYNNLGYHLLEVLLIYSDESDIKESILSEVLVSLITKENLLNKEQLDSVSKYIESNKNLIESYILQDSYNDEYKLIQVYNIINGKPSEEFSSFSKIKELLINKEEYQNITRLFFEGIYVKNETQDMPSIILLNLLLNYFSDFPKQMKRIIKDLILITEN